MLKKKNFPSIKNTLFYIECACGCGRALPIDYAPKTDDIEIAQLGVKIWEQLGSKNGLEGAIDFFHKCSDID